MYPVEKILFTELRVLLSEFYYSLRDNQGSQNNCPSYLEGPTP